MFSWSHRFSHVYETSWLSYTFSSYCIVPIKPSMFHNHEDMRSLNPMAFN